MSESPIVEFEAPRIVVQGASGSGKSSLAATLAVSLGVPHLELDSIYHQPGWTSLDVGEFRHVVSVFATQQSWVVDGNYSQVRDLLWSRANIIVFVDLPRRVVMTRLVIRTLRRILRHEDLWNGNRESLRNLVSTDPLKNIILWSWLTHAKYHDVVPDEARRNASHANVVTLRTPSDVQAFLRKVASFI
jgi:adenylate kinase family enzyme